MKKLGFIIGLTLILGFAVESIGAEFAFHGDMNNRFLVYPSDFQERITIHKIMFSINSFSYTASNSRNSCFGGTRCDYLSPVACGARDTYRKVGFYYSFCNFICLNTKV